MLSALVRVLLWRLLHLLAALIAFVRPLWQRFVRRATKHSPEGIPTHVALLLSGEDDSAPFERLAELVVWSLIAGVHTFSLYEPSGNLKKHEDKLIKKVEELKVTVAGEIRWNDRLNINGYKNGTNRRLAVYVFSSEDGKNKLLNIVRDLCGNNTPSDFSLSVESMDSRIGDAYSHLTEPNLAIYCGEKCSPYGFLPWHIRLTEFFRLDSLESVTLEDYKDLLCRYAKCQKRFGK